METPQKSVVDDSELIEVTTPELKSLAEDGVLREALLQEKLDKGRVRCNICQRRCNIPENKAGYCMTKVNIGGTLYTTIYGVISSAAADPIEKKPVYHFKPGSLCYSVGSLGCNFRCMFCQNWQIAFADAVQPSGMCRYDFLPEDLIKAAQETGCEGIAWTYNEPGIWLNYTLDGAKLAKEAGLYTVYVTNGYATEEHLDLIGPFLDVYRVDIKSMEDDFYRKLIRVPSVSGILKIAERAKSKWRMHIECVTNIIPTWNDSDDNLRCIARWIAENLGELTPWHVTRFFPYAKLQDVPPTPPATLLRAAEIGHEQGLKFVYIGNYATPKGQNTYCYTDGTLAIERTGYQTRIVAVTRDGKCVVDGADLNVRI
ncbi:MAG TPA: AmmeMemoRadiSam system radical SAM enzyme [Armatimonadota bacterium]|nr:AmmeMemoRadiSam system radical SAM enzyme [Armatimonadota bacterium]